MSGDWEAFRHLVDAYQARALRHAVAVVGEIEEARDATQEAFLDAFRALDRFDDTHEFYPWLYTMLRHRCFKSIATRQRRRSECLEGLDLEAPARGLSPDETLTLNGALLRLSVEDREIVILRHFDGLSYEELSEWLGVPTGTVMSRLFYARKRLREAVQGSTVMSAKEPK